MEVEMKRREMVEMWGTMKQFSDEKLSKKFIFAMAINESRVDDDVQAVILAQKPADSYSEYEKKRMDILFIHAETGDNDQVAIDNSHVRIKPENIDIVRSELKELDDEYRDVLDERNADLVDFGELLESTTIVDIQMVSYDDLPDEISKNDYMALKPMIEINEEG